MKINEVITESKFGKGSTQALPDLETYAALDNNNSPYAAYRFGIALAGAPDYEMPLRGPIGGRFATIGYSDGDREITEKAKKIMGVKSTQESPDGSSETEFINTQSPMQPKGPVKRKSK